MKKRRVLTLEGKEGAMFDREHVMSEVEKMMGGEASPRMRYRITLLACLAGDVYSAAMTTVFVYSNDTKRHWRRLYRAVCNIGATREQLVARDKKAKTVEEKRIVGLARSFNRLVVEGKIERKTYFTWLRDAWKAGVQQQRIRRGGEIGEVLSPEQMALKKAAYLQKFGEQSGLLSEV